MDGGRWVQLEKEGTLNLTFRLGCASNFDHVFLCYPIRNPLQTRMSWMAWMQTVKFLLEGVLLPVVGGLGLIGNLASIAVLRSKSIEWKQNFCQVNII